MASRWEKALEAWRSGEMTHLSNEDLEGCVHEQVASLLNLPQVRYVPQPRALRRRPTPQTAAVSGCAVSGTSGMPGAAGGVARASDGRLVGCNGRLRGRTRLESQIGRVDQGR